MTNDSTDDTKIQVYLNNYEFINLQQDYQRGYTRNTNDPAQILLVAKACFFKHKYSECKKLLTKLNKDYNTKILYERQTLLFKVCYLLEPQNIEELENIVRDYDRSRNRCPGKPLTQFHHQSLNQMLDIVKRGRQQAKNSHSFNKQQIRQKIKIEQKRTKFEGFPSYIISASWNNKFNDYLQKDGPYPGPITNFQLINHVFELEPHNQPSKDYMDKLLFPYIEENNYYVIVHKHWAVLQKIFMGYPVKRVFTVDIKTRQLTGCDNLIKTFIECENDKVVLQWQAGSFWQKSILPVLTQKFGPGQLKQKTQNKDFIIVPPIRAQQPFTKLKYVRIDPNLIKAVGQKQQMRKKKIMSYYDMQKYNPDECQSKYTVGLVNITNTCYMNSALQVLSNLRILASYFLANKYLSKLNIGQLNKDGSYGQVTCAYADLVKRLWFSPPQTRYIDPTMFKKVFGQRYQLFDSFQQQDAQQFLMFLLNCLHQDLNQNAQMNVMQRQSMSGKAFELVRNNTINHHNKHNRSIISELFHGFHYQEIKCDSCDFKNYRFEDHLMIHIQVPPDAPKLTVFLVEASNQAEAKRVDVYIKKLENLNQVMDIISKHFFIKPQHNFVPFLYGEDPKQWKELSKDTEIKYIMKLLTKEKAGSYLFLYQIPKPQVDEEIAMISYFYQAPFKREIQNDGFPRILPIKKIYKEKQYQDQIFQIVLSTVVKNKFNRDKKQYIKQIKHKKISNKFYVSQYKVFTQIRLSNFNNVGINKILGENSMEDSVTLEGCLEKMSKQEVIDIKEGWYCDKCRKIRTAHKTDKIYSVGRYLIVQLKRFTENGKITTKIIYPINNLNMRPYIQDTNSAGPYNYNLQAVILHRGSLDKGHYTCICRSKDHSQWLYYDDQTVREIEQNLVVDTNAYILVYQKADGLSTYISSSNSYLPN